MSEFTDATEALDRIEQARRQQQRPVAEEQPERPAADTPEAAFLAQIRQAQARGGGWTSVPLDGTTDGGRF